MLRSGGPFGCIDHGPARKRTRDRQNCRWVGGNFAVRREAAQRVGWYDVRLARGQDTEYYWRSLEAGLQVCYEPDAMVFHRLERERMTPEYARYWYHRTGCYRACQIPWKPHHLLTIVPLWWYQEVGRQTVRWMGKVVWRAPWPERFSGELAFRASLSTWIQRLRMWPQYARALVTGHPQGQA